MKRPSFLIPLLTVAALAAIAWWALRPGAFEPIPIEFPAYDLSEFGVTEQWQREQAAAAELTETEQRMLGAWQDANVARALLAVDLFEGDNSIPLARENMLRSDVLLEGGADRLRVLGWAAYAEFRQGLVAALSIIERRELTVAEFMQLVADPEVQEVLPRVGDFLVWSLNQGLVTAEGQLTVPESTVALLFFYKWLVESGGQVPVEQSLLANERIAFERWKMEDSGASLESRLRAVERLTDNGEIGGLPSLFYEGVLRWKAGEYEAALPLLRAAAAAAPDSAWVVAVAQSAELGPRREPSESGSEGATTSR
ncbi:MAG: hypothetical protein ACI81R_000554 [Bradymonadia bacterium]|jgi:hypothetical protein